MRSCSAALDARPLVVDRVAELLRLARDLDEHLAAVRRELHRVRDDVRERLTELARIGHHGPAAGVLHRDVQARVLDHRPQLGHHVVGELVRIHRPLEDRRLARLEAREVGEVVDDAGEARHRLDHRVDDALLLRRHRPELVRGEDPQVPRERRERRRELVREVVHERALQLVELDEPRVGAARAGERRFEVRRHHAGEHAPPLPLALLGQPLALALEVLRAAPRPGVRPRSPARRTRRHRRRSRRRARRASRRRRRSARSRGPSHA